MERTKEDLRFTGMIISKILASVLWFLLLPLFLIQDIIIDIKEKKK